LMGRESGEGVGAAVRTALEASTRDEIDSDHGPFGSGITQEKGGNNEGETGDKHPIRAVGAMGAVGEMGGVSAVVGQRVHAVVDSPIGDLTLVAQDGVLCALYMEAQAHRPADEALGQRTQSGFAAEREQLSEYFAGKRTEFAVPLAPVGTPFQMLVWQELRAIPYGQTRTYSHIAAQISGGSVAGVRAVGAANGRNPISIIVPCHRVIGADGSLTGYGGGVERKQYLLTMENPARVAAASLF
jgi:methylated-DNA-[protein]-cysteine S-methyltransferase